MNKPADFPDKSKVVLIIIDMINDLEFEDGEKMLPPALEAAHNIKKFKFRLHDHSIPTIYVNDNFGKWRSDFRQLVKHALEDYKENILLLNNFRPKFPQAVVRQIFLPFLLLQLSRVHSCN